MQRYIDAELAKQALTGWETDPTDEEILLAIDRIPTADVVPKSEWKPVSDPPKKAGRYIVYGIVGGMPLICGAHYDKYNGFGDDDFTHWMPLPEPPVMKGGAE